MVINRITKGMTSLRISGLVICVIFIVIWAIRTLLKIDTDLIVCIVVAVAAWIMLMLAGRRLLIWKDRKIIEGINEEIPHLSGASGIADVLHSLENAITRRYGGGSNRLLLQVKWMKRTMEIAGNMRGNSIVSSYLIDSLKYEEEYSINWYIPVSSLIWSLPAVGFLGTAWKIRSGVMILFNLDMMAGIEFSEILDMLGPPLISAFFVICLALLLTVITYIFSAITMKVDNEVSQAASEAIIYAMSVGGDEESFG